MITETNTVAAGHYVQANGLRIHYEECGEGMPLLLIHGGSGIGANWRPFLPYFSQHYRVIIPDTRGHGLTANPTGEYSYRQMAEALYKREMNRASLDMLSKAIAIDPATARTYADRGRVLRALGRLDEAYDSFEQGIKMGLDVTVQMDAYFNQGMIRSKQTRYAEAIERFQRALEKDPYFYLARKNLAFAYLQADRYFEAEREFGLLARANSTDEDVVKAMRFLRQRIK